MRAQFPSLSREPFTVGCDDGWILRGDVVGDPRTPPVAVAIAGHAMMVDRRTLDRGGRGLVSHLAAREIAVVWPDLRGHGKSGPRASDGGDWSYDDLVERDTAALSAFARARFPSLPCVAVGHSLFGHVALAHVARHRAAPIDALVLLACNVAHPGWSHPSRLVKGALIELMGLATRIHGYLPVRRFGAGSDDESRSYVADFVRGWRSNEWRARDGFDYWRALPSVNRPVLALVGAADRLLSPPEDARSLVSPLLEATFAVVGKASGLAFDPDHMGLVLDERARPAWEEVAQFIRAVKKIS